MNSMRLADDWLKPLLFFTNWTLQVTMYTALVGMIIARNAENTVKNAPKLNALHHILYTLTMAMNALTVCIYWSVIRPGHLVQLKEKAKGDEGWERAYIFHANISHTVPIILAFILMCITDS